MILRESHIDAEAQIVRPSVITKIRKYNKSGNKKSYMTHTEWSQEDLRVNKRILNNYHGPIIKLAKLLQNLLYPNKTIPSIQSNLYDLKNDRYLYKNGCFMHWDMIARENGKLHNKDFKYAMGRNDKDVILSQSPLIKLSRIKNNQ